MIAADLTASVTAALAAAGLPAPPRGVEVTPAKSRDHGDWQTNVALTLAKTVGAPPRDVAGRVVDALRAAIERDYPARTGLRPTVIEVDAVDGAGWVDPTR